MKIALIASDASLAAWLSDSLGSRFQVQWQADESVYGFDAVICEWESWRIEQRRQQVQRWLQQEPDLPIVALGSQPEGTVILEALALGIRDYWLKGEAEGLPDRLLRLRRREAASSLPPSGGLTVITGAFPHESQAFLATHLALLWAESSGDGRRTLLLDASLPAGAANVFLNLQSHYHTSDLCRDTFRCDQNLVETAITRHRSGLSVISLPEEGFESTDWSSLPLLLPILRSLFSHTFVVLNPSVSVEVVGQVLSAADRALLVCDQSVLKSRQAKVWLRALRLAGFALDKLALVVDGYDKKMGIEPQQLAESLALPLLVSLPVQPQHRAESMNLGQPLGQLHPKDPYYVGLMALVATWQGAVRPVKRWWR